MNSTTLGQWPGRLPADRNIAVAFVGFLVVFTFQVGFICQGRPDLHRRIGMSDYWADYFHLYLGSDLLMLGLGAYDLVTRRSLHPAYIAAALWMITPQLTGHAGLYSPGWKAVSLHLIGH
jgi:hypothetical protein